jgi:hypothetical protein
MLTKQSEMQSQVILISSLNKVVLNSYFPFKKETDIEGMLKKQWSSYFQKLIKEQFGKKEKSDNNKLEKK